MAAEGDEAASESFLEGARMLRNTSTFGTMHVLAVCEEEHSMLENEALRMRDACVNELSCDMMIGSGLEPSHEMDERTGVECPCQADSRQLECILECTLLPRSYPLLTRYYPIINP